MGSCLADRTPVVLSQAEKQHLYTPTCIEISKFDLHYAGALIDVVQRNLGKQFVFKARVIDHKSPSLTVKQVLEKVGPFKLRLSYQTYNVLENGVVGLDFIRKPNSYRLQKLYDWNITKQIPTIKKTECQYKGKYYFINGMNDMKHQDILTAANYPVLSATEDVLAKAFTASGITSGYYYIGEASTMFGFHLEDHLFGSFNYVVSGIKIWYVIDPANNDDVELLNPTLSNPKLKNYTFKKCHQKLNHRNLFMSPEKLKNLGIRFHVVIQRESEVMFLGPNVWHAGYNLTDCAALALNCIGSDWLSLSTNDHNKMCIVSDHGNTKKCSEIKLSEVTEYEETRSSMVNAIINLNEKLQTVKGMKNSCARFAKTETGRESTQTQAQSFNGEIHGGFPETDGMFSVNMLGSEIDAVSTVSDSVGSIALSKPKLQKGSRSDRKNAGRFWSRFHKNHLVGFQQALDCAKENLTFSSDCDIVSFMEECVTSLKPWKLYGGRKNKPCTLYLQQKKEKGRELFIEFLQSVGANDSIVCAYKSKCKQKWG